MYLKESFKIVSLTQLALTVLLAGCFTITGLLQLKNQGVIEGDPINYTTIPFTPLLIAQLVIATLLTVAPLFFTEKSINHLSIIPYEIPYLISTISVFIVPYLAEFMSIYFAEGISAMSTILLENMHLILIFSIVLGCLIIAVTHINICISVKKSQN